MGKQIIISIGRQYGSAGHEIGKKLAEKLDIPIYDRNLFDELGKVKGIDTNNLVKYDEKPKSRLFSRTVRGYSSSPEENVAELQFALLKSRWADGDSFVVVGRCADELFRGKEGFVSFFITGDIDERVKRIMSVRNMDEKTAKIAIDRHDRKRKQYHDYFSKGGKWGDVKNYDVCVNSSRLGIDGTVEFLYQYIQQIIK
ncbi:MAG: cytidylate kinase-like family protein [Treponema sp.]|nr:cytidylate kinase-like family protein [Spirochaetia bacterium]MDY2839513.1 cytidylate kinase-like family protein [Treponema sp.]MDY5123387.1 cytidylate kinase-like family protein [Treponema sp.]